MCQNRETPWGRSDHVRVIAPGITEYQTPSHGGIHLSSSRLSQMPSEARAYAAKWSHGWGDAWYEEDCAAAWVIVTFPDLFPLHVVKAARQMVDTL